MLKKAPCMFGSAIVLGLLLAVAGILLLIGIPIDRIVNNQVIGVSEMLRNAEFH